MAPHSHTIRPKLRQSLRRDGSAPNFTTVCQVWKLATATSARPVANMSEK